MPENKTKIELSESEAALFLYFRAYQTLWEKLFDKQFTGSLTLHIRDGELMRNEWRICEKVIHPDT